MKKIILLRHAKSLLNEAPTIPEAHNVLSPYGVSQALEAGARLKDAGIRVIATSPVMRAYQTAMIVSGQLGGLPIEVHDDLAELKSRNPHGIDEWLGPELMKEFEEGIDVVPAWGLESQRMVFDRVRRFASAHFERLASVGPALIVSHTFALRGLISLIEHGNPERMVEYRLRNAEPMHFPVDRELLDRL